MQLRALANLFNPLLPTGSR